MADEKEISLKQFIEAKLESFSTQIREMVTNLAERVNDLRESIRFLDSKQDRQQQQYLDAVSRQQGDDKEMRREISDIRDRQSVQNGMRNVERMTQEKADFNHDRAFSRKWSSEYLMWMKLIAIAAVIGVIVAVAVKFL